MEAIRIEDINIYTPLAGSYLWSSYKYLEYHTTWNRYIYTIFSTFGCLLARINFHSYPGITVSSN